MKKQQAKQIVENFIRKEVRRSLNEQNLFEPYAFRNLENAAQLIDKALISVAATKNSANNVHIKPELIEIIKRFRIVSEELGNLAEAMSALENDGSNNSELDAPTSR